jgi:hypothetical protein
MSEDNRWLNVQCPTCRVMGTNCVSILKPLGRPVPPHATRLALIQLLPNIDMGAVEEQFPKVTNNRT